MIFRSLLVVTALMIALPIRLQAQVAETDTRGPGWSADPETVDRLSKKRSEFNYVESEVPTYQLPDPLRLENGDQVTEAATWRKRRRPELMELFRENVYGRRPDTPYEVSFEENSKSTVLDGTAIGREMRATIKIDDRTFSFPFVLFVPTEVSTPVPAVILINNRYFTPVKDITDNYDSFYPVKDLIDRGYATASFFTSDVDPDNHKEYDKGIRSFFAGGKKPDEDAWRSLSAWGFGASRVLEHLGTVPEIDASKIAIVGHSRGGKTALWAAAEDPRFAIAYSNHSGCGGAALSRRAFGETVGRITSSFPHWFVPKFGEYAGRESQLPIDQHELISLVAPRGVYITSADEDLWADPKGEYLSLVAAAPVFDLLGKASIGQNLQSDALLPSHISPPPLDTPQVVGVTGYHIGSGGHGLEHTDWRWFLDFADGLLK